MEEMQATDAALKATEAELFSLFDELTGTNAEANAELEALKALLK